MFLLYSLSLGPPFGPLWLGAPGFARSEPIVVTPLTKIDECYLSRPFNQANLIHSCDTRGHNYNFVIPINQTPIIFLNSLEYNGAMPVPVVYVIQYQLKLGISPH
jgi:hypothetical protein